MEKLAFKVIIKAPKERVWNIIIGKETYPIWTAEFCEGSMVETDWKTGSKALFLDQTNSGMVSIIEESTPYSFLSIKHIGEMKNGVEDTESDQVKSWGGCYENYTLENVNNSTSWLVEMTVPPEFGIYMKDLWPKAQQKVKELAEASY